ncbi:MAG: isoprenylcysteine carboxylmethyltransferase family protein [Candidatus Latescibacteria bacterium]|nr:isoprenylcysteine carboxylmethyltransferase family protein [Candidatus Latescibacterota bacterium]
MRPAPDRPGIIAPPPLIYLVPFAAGLWLQRHLPLSLEWGGWEVWLGWPLVGAACLGFVLALMALARAGTSVNPYRASSAVAAAGIYRFSRNPIYLADTLFYLGAALLWGSGWQLLLLPVVLVVVQKGVITREEAYLERKFGAAYLAYKNRVRRWV